MKLLQSALLFLLFIIIVANLIDPAFDPAKFSVGALAGFTTVVVTTAALSALNVLGSGLNPMGTFIIAAFLSVTVLIFGFDFSFDVGPLHVGITFGANLIQGLQNTIGEIPVFGNLIVALIVLMLYIIVTLVIFSGRGAS